MSAEASAETSDDATTSAGTASSAGPDPGRSTARPLSDVTAPRSHLVRALEADLVGPFRKDAPEDLELPPSRWYLTGFLAPHAGREPESDETNEEFAAGNDESDEEAGNADPEPKRKNIFPASLGLSVIVPGETRELRATVRYANYERVDVDEGGRKGASQDKGRRVWRRHPMGPVTETLDLAASDLADPGVAVAESRGLRLVAQVQELPPEAGAPPGSRAVAVFLVNDRAPDDAPGQRDGAYVFQVELTLECAEGFVPRPDRSAAETSDRDEQIADLQFRDAVDYAVGHGVSVEVPEDQPDSTGGAVTRVRTCWIPRYEVRPVVAHSEPGVTVDMDRLAELHTADEVEQHLARLPEAYGEWIAAQRQLPLEPGQRSETRDALCERAELARARIRDGIELLRERRDVLEAFVTANRAMAEAARRRSPERYQDAAPAWRLFQLAFVLLNLRGLADPTHEDRERAELIFFPTGGGKTEAYLGVIAVALVLRRLRGQREAHAGLGVAVILRYTLRLLTLDQLGRAATLICALESERRRTPARLGAERFAVGLWVGRSATSNTMAEVAKQVRRFQVGSGPNPCPLTACPWCQAELGPTSLSLLTAGKVSSKSPEEVRVACPNDRCEFAARNHPEGIPIVFVDEQVYRELPSFLIGTVDKFAMLPWRGEAGKLFGKVTGRAGRIFFNPADGKLPSGSVRLVEGAPPPELIVQDELHLISGPLGTLVGLYETAIDFSSTRLVEGKAVRPKVLAATATVRRATEQMQALYGRMPHQVCVFPPPGPDPAATFFSKLDERPEVPGRLYVGVAAQGRAMKAILLRVYRVLMSAAARVYDPTGPEDQPADAYRTLVGYFNSLRELGGMRRIAEDELRVRLKDVEKLHPLQHRGPHPWFRDVHWESEPLELTSRESTFAVGRTKARLAKSARDKEHVPVLLASNMISVGVDIDRLGLMVVAGQPKTTAEYIQASSRVGRQARFPGLVVTCMNIHKSRDRSHYERFVAYHQSFYRFVEATSVTPFSGPALDRGLAGTLVAMTRFAHPDLMPAAGVLEVAKHSALAEAAADALAQRAARQPGQDRAGAEELVAQVRERSINLLETWKSIVASTPEETAKARYSPFDREKTGGPPLLHTALDPNAPDPMTPEGRFRAPTSMRDVEETTHLWLRPRLGPFEGKRR